MIYEKEKNIQSYKCCTFRRGVCQTRKFCGMSDLEQVTTGSVNIFRGGIGKEDKKCAKITKIRYVVYCYG